MIAEGPQARLPNVLHVRPAPHLLLFHCIATKLALPMDVRFVPYLLLHNISQHDQSILPSNLPNLPDGRAQVVIDQVLHAIDDFLAVKVSKVQIFSFLQ